MDRENRTVRRAVAVFQTGHLQDLRPDGGTCGACVPAHSGSESKHGKPGCVRPHKPLLQLRLDHGTVKSARPQRR